MKITLHSIFDLQESETKTVFFLKSSEKFCVIKVIQFRFTSDTVIMTGYYKNVSDRKIVILTLVKRFN